MKKGKGFWKFVVFFLAGCLFSYITLQWKFFKINLDVHVPELLATLLAAMVGLYIADTIQRRMAKNQNQYTYLGGKLDVLWSSFNKYADSFNFATSIDLPFVNHFNKEAIISIGFLKNI